MKTLEDMPPAGPKPVGRRERNKQDKLDRIVAAARQLFEAHGVDATFVTVAGVGHDFEQMTSVPEVTDALIGFFERTLK